jgi:hypothetical protein
MAIRYILRTFGLIYGHLVYFMDIWFNLWTFGTFNPVLLSIKEKNLATPQF